MFIVLYLNHSDACITCELILKAALRLHRVILRILINIRVYLFMSVFQPWSFGGHEGSNVYCSTYSQKWSRHRGIEKHLAVHFFNSHKLLIRRWGIEQIYLSKVSHDGVIILKRKSNKKMYRMFYWTFFIFCYFCNRLTIFILIYIFSIIAVLHMDIIVLSVQIIEDWKYIAMVLDRLFLWLFTIACATGK